MVVWWLFPFAKYFLYSIARHLLSATKYLWWLVNGTYFQLWQNRQMKYYDWSAHVLTIHFRCKFDVLLQPSGPDNFISTHHSFQHPKYILKDNVTLYYVTKDEAVFVETDSRVDAAHSKHGSFMRGAQFYLAKKVIVLPIHSFHKMAEQIGDIKGTLIFASNTGRCGSTLLSQIFEETGRSLALSEPDALNAVSAYRGKLPQEELDKIIISSVRILCKPRRQPIDFYALKTTAPTIDAVPMFIRLFPKSKQVFMYREGLPVAISYLKIATELPLLKLAILCSKYSENMSKKMVDMMGLPSESFKVRITDSLVFGLHIWACLVGVYNKFRQQGIEIVAIKYDDLVEFPLAATQAFFKYCDVPMELADKAIGALNQDSQRKSPLNMKNMSKVKTPELTPERKVKTDAICDQFDLPRIPETCVVDGTITHIRELLNSSGTAT